MALKALLETLDDVPEAVRGEYKETKIGDRTVFVLDVEGVDDHPSVKNLKTAHDRVKADKTKALSDLAAAKQRLEGLPDDFDPDEFARLQSEEASRLADPANTDVNKRIEAAVAAVKTQLDAKITRLTKENDGKIAEKDKVVASLNAQLRKLIVDGDLTKHLISAGVDPELLEGAKALIERNVEVVEEGEELVARMKADLGGEQVDVFIQNWVQTDKGKRYVAPAKGADEPGTARGKAGVGGGANPFAKGQWNKTEQGHLVRADRPKAERLAKAAGFKSLEATFTASGPVAA